MATMPTKQYNVRLDVNLIARLEGIAELYNRDSGNKVAAEIVELFLDVWEDAEKARFRVINQHRAGELKMFPVENDIDLPMTNPVNKKKKSAK